jgi:geranylgeranyl diphosphate synthase type II
MEDVMEGHSVEPESSQPPKVLGDRGYRDVDVGCKASIEARLDELIPDDSVHPELLHQAMRYSLMAGGKRIRPMLTVQVARDFGSPIEKALDPACAIEMIHTASLVFDDMPSMDNAALRRGRPTNHLVFGDDVATLAATALLNRAFGVVAECEDLDPSVRVDLVRLYSDAVGSNGIIAGQFRDLRTEWRSSTDAGKLLDMYGQKTGALFVAAVEAGARIAGVSDEWVAAVRSFATNLGLAFQILDDLLDCYSSEEHLGKDIGQDRHKTTFVSCLGADGARLEVCRFVQSAASALEPLGDSATPLLDLARSYTEPTMERVLYL